MSANVMKPTYIPKEFSGAYAVLDYSYYMNELIDATASLEVYIKK